MNEWRVHRALPVVGKAGKAAALIRLQEYAELGLGRKEEATKSAGNRDLSSLDLVLGHHTEEKSTLGHPVAHHRTSGHTHPAGL